MDECEGVNSSYYGAPVCTTADNDCLSKPRLPSWYEETSIGPNDRCRRRVPATGLTKHEMCGEGGSKFVYAVEGSEEQCGYEELVFDRTIMTNTLIEEYHLICDRLEGKVLILYPEINVQVWAEDNIQLYIHVRPAVWFLHIWLGI